jgi:hypothetical protein
MPKTNPKPRKKTPKKSPKRSDFWMGSKMKNFLKVLGFLTLTVVLGSMTGIIISLASCGKGPGPAPIPTPVATAIPATPVPPTPVPPTPVPTPDPTIPACKSAMPIGAPPPAVASSDGRWLCWDAKGVLMQCPDLGKLANVSLCARALGLHPRKK